MQVVKIGESGDRAEIRATVNADGASHRLEIRAVSQGLERSHVFPNCGDDPAGFLAGIDDDYVLDKFLRLGAREIDFAATRAGLVEAVTELEESGEITARDARLRRDAIGWEAQIIANRSGLPAREKADCLLRFATEQQGVPFEMLGGCIAYCRSAAAETFLAEFWEPLRAEIARVGVEIAAPESDIDDRMEFA